MVVHQVSRRSHREQERQGGVPSVEHAPPHKKKKKQCKYAKKRGSGEKKEDVKKKGDCVTSRAFFFLQKKQEGHEREEQHCNLPRCLSLATSCHRHRVQKKKTDDEWRVARALSDLLSRAESTVSPPHQLQKYLYLRRGGNEK